MSGEAKHEPRSEAEQRHTWRGEAAQWMAGEEYVDEMVSEVLQRRVEAVRDDRPGLPWINSSRRAELNHKGPVARLRGSETGPGG